jgi:hypothetical protein
MISIAGPIVSQALTFSFHGLPGEAPVIGEMLYEWVLFNPLFLPLIARRGHGSVVRAEAGEDGGWDEQPQRLAQRHSIN